MFLQVIRKLNYLTRIFMHFEILLSGQLLREKLISFFQKLSMVWVVINVFDKGWVEIDQFSINITLK